MLGSWGRVRMKTAVLNWTAGEAAGVIEDGHQSFQSAVAEFVERVAAGQDEIGAGMAQCHIELRMGPDPAIDGGPVDTVLFGGSGEGGTGGQRIGNALLDGGEGGMERRSMPYRSYSMAADGRRHFLPFCFVVMGLAEICGV